MLSHATFRRSFEDNEIFVFFFRCNPICLNFVVILLLITLTVGLRGGLRVKISLVEVSLDPLVVEWAYVTDYYQLGQ